MTHALYGWLQPKIPGPPKEFGVLYGPYLTVYRDRQPPFSIPAGEVVEWYSPPTAAPADKAFEQGERFREIPRHPNLVIHQKPVERT